MIPEIDRGHDMIKSKWAGMVALGWRLLREGVRQTDRSRWTDGKPTMRMITDVGGVRTHIVTRTYGWEGRLICE